jgi:membrane protease YdiL (CAAX protease family)
VLTISLTVAVLFAANIPLFAFLAMEAEKLGIVLDEINLGSLPPGLNRNLFFALFLIPFAVGFAAFWLFIRLFHAKPLVAVITGRRRFDWRRAAIGFVLWFALLAVSAFAFLATGSYSFQFDPSAFLILVVIALALIPIQSAFEEIFFRGYLMQGIALLSKNKIVPLIVVTALFTLVHVQNPEFSGDWWRIGLTYLSIATLFGLTAILDDGLEVPCGIHAANNIFGAVVLRPDYNSTFFTDSLFTAPFPDLLRFSPYVDIATALVAFFILYRIYGWRFSTLAGPVAPPEAASAETAGISS